jgi:hypothetical protein
VKRRSPDFDAHLIEVVLDWVAATTAHPLTIVAIPGHPPVLNVVALDQNYTCTCPDANAGLPCWHAIAIVQTLRDVTGGTDARPT